MHGLSRIAARRGMQVSRTLSTTAASQSQVSTETQKEWYPKLGNREIVGYGFNSNPVYVDREEFPMPAIRFRENTADILALREKEKGDWKNLTIDEKKALYRASFRQTFAEMKAPTGEWKSITAGILMGLSVTLWAMIWMKKYVYPQIPATITEEWKADDVRKQVRQRQNPISGIASKYDYENNKWK